MSDILLEKLEDMGAEVEDTLERMMGDKEMYRNWLLLPPLQERQSKSLHFL